MARYGVYTKFVAQAGQRDALVALLLEAARGMEGSAGAECEVYIVNTSPDEAEAIWVTEVWSEPGGARGVARAAGDAGGHRAGDAADRGGRAADRGRAGGWQGIGGGVAMSATDAETAQSWR